MLGKLYWYLQKTNKSILSLKEALKILNITHGNSKVVSDLMCLLEEAEAEFKYKQSLRDFEN